MGEKVKALKSLVFVRGKRVLVKDVLKKEFSVNCGRQNSHYFFNRTISISPVEKAYYFFKIFCDISHF